MKIIKTIALTCALLSTTNIYAAEPLRIANPHLYLKGEINSGNIYTFAAATLVTGWINYGIHHNYLLSSFIYEFPSADINGKDAKFKSYSPFGLSAREIFNDISPEIKLGWKSHNFGSFDWGVYGDLQYKQNQFKTDLFTTDYADFKLRRVGIGGGLLGIFGGLNAKYRVTMEAGAKYTLPVGIKSATLGDDASTDMLNSGVTSHFALKIGGSDSLQDFGIFADFDHFNLFDKGYSEKGGSPLNNANFKNFCVGVSFNVTFGQAEKRTIDY